VSEKSLPLDATEARRILQSDPTLRPLIDALIRYALTFEMWEVPNFFVYLRILKPLGLYGSSMSAQQLLIRAGVWTENTVPYVEKLAHSHLRWGPVLQEWTPTTPSSSSSSSTLHTTSLYTSSLSATSTTAAPTTTATISASSTFTSVSSSYSLPPISDDVRRVVFETPAYAIDDATTTEVDDAISLEQRGDQLWVHVHISAPVNYCPSSMTYSSRYSLRSPLLTFNCEYVI
jgi:hypothetical protein